MQTLDLPPPRPAGAAPIIAAAPAMTPGLWAILVFLGVVWGGSFLFTQVAVREIPPFTLVAGRTVLAAAALLVFVAARRLDVRPLRRRFGAFVVLGLVNNWVPFVLLALCQTRLGAGLTSVLSATTPLFTILIASLVTRDERLSLNRVGGLALGLAGVAVLTGPALWSQGGAPIWAFLAVLGASVSYGVGAVYAGRFKGVDPATIATGQLIGSAVPALLLAFTVDGLPAAPSPLAFACLMGLALVSSSFAYILYFTVVAEAGATNATLVTFLVPAAAIVSGILVLGESFSPREGAGLVLIVGGLVAVDGRVLRRRGA